jgi:DNA-binding PadR family transcriptional regulator
MLQNHSLKVFALKALNKGHDISFMEMVELLNVTEGNIYHSLNSLLFDGYIEKVPNVDRLTIYRITPRGKAVFEWYVRQLMD